MSLFRSTITLHKDASSQLFNNLINIVKTQNDTVESILEKLNQIQSLQDLQQKAEEEGITTENVADFIQQLSKWVPSWNNVGNSIMLNPISNLEKKQTWPLINIEPGDSNRLTGNLAWVFNYQLEAGLDINYQPQVPDFLEGNVATDTRFLNYSLSGKMAAGTSVSLSLAKAALAFSAGGAVQASANGAISFYFNHTPEILFFDALVQDLPQLSKIENYSSFDLNNEQGNLQAVSIDLSGEVKLSANMNLGYRWDTGVLINDSSDNKPIGVDLGVAAKASWQLSGEMTLFCYRVEGENSIMIELQRSKTQSDDKSLSIGATISAPGIQDVARKYLSELTEYKQQLQSFLDVYGEPKKWLIENINKQFVDNPDWVQKIIGLASGQEDSTQLQEGLATKISDELAIPFTKIDEWLNDQDQKDIIATQISKVFGQEKGSEAEQYILKLLNNNLNDYQTEISTKIKGWLSDAANKEILEPLAEFGLDVNNLLDQTDAEVKKVLQPLYKFNAYYQSKLQLLTDFVDNTMTEELGMSFVQSEKETDIDSALIKVKLKLNQEEGSQNSKTIAKLYQQCLLGDFSELLTLYRSDDDYSNLFTLEESVFKSAQNRENIFSISINLFGLKSRSQTIMNSDAIIEYDGKGQLSVFESKAVFERIKESGNEAKQVKVLNQVNLLQGSKSKYSVVAEYDDSDLTTNELVGFLDLFESVGMTPENTAVKVKQKLIELSLIDVSQEHPLTLRNGLSLTPEQISIACEQGDTEVELVALKQQSFAWIKYTKLHPQSQYATSLYIIQCYDKQQDLYVNIKTLALMTTNKRKKALNKVIETEFSNASSKWMKNMILQTRIRIEKINENAQLLPQYLDALKKLRNRPIPTTVSSSTSQSIKDDLNNASDELNELLRSWIQSFGTVFEIDMDRVHPTTVAFINSMRILSGAENELTVPLVYQKVEGQLPKPIMIL